MKQDVDIPKHPHKGQQHTEPKHGITKASIPTIDLP